MIQFAGAVSFEVTLASDGPLNEFCCVHEGLALWAMRKPSRCPFSSVVGSTVEDNVISQTKYSLLTVSDFEPTVADENTDLTGGVEQSTVASKSGGGGGGGCHGQ